MNFRMPEMPEDEIESEELDLEESNRGNGKVSEEEKAQFLIPQVLNYADMSLDDLQKRGRDLEKIFQSGAFNDIYKVISFLKNYTHGMVMHPQVIDPSQLAYWKGRYSALEEIDRLPQAIIDDLFQKMTDRRDGGGVAPSKNEGESIQQNQKVVRPDHDPGFETE